MKILVICQYYFPEQFQINEIAPELVKRGHEVTVLTGTPNYPSGEVFPGYEGGKRAEENIEGVHVLRTPIRPRKTGAANLIRNYASFSRQGSRAAQKLPAGFDVVFCYQLSPVTMVDPAIVYTKAHGIPLVLYCLDIWPESASAHLGAAKCFAYPLVKAISKRRYAACNRVAVTSRPFIDYLHEVNGIARKRLSYIPQHASDAYLESDLASTDNGVVDFMFAGNIGAGQTLDVAIKATALLKDRTGFLVHMVGDGSDRVRLEAMATELGIADRVVFHGSQKREDMPAFYKMADALLITLRGDNAVGGTMPGKLPTYMSVGKPILGAINGAANEAISESKCGACVPAEDYEGLAALMSGFMDNPKAYRECGQNARRYFKENFTLKLYCDRLEALLRESIESHAN